MKYEFTIGLPPITKKNHQKIIWQRGRHMIIQSDVYRKYEDDAQWYIPVDVPEFKYPVNVKGIFYMPTRRKTDLVNLQEALCDVLVKYGVLEDDNYKIVAGMDGSRVKYDKENPRTEITITEIDE